MVTRKKLRNLFDITGIIKTNLVNFKFKIGKNAQ